MSIKYFTGNNLDATNTKTKSNGTTVAYVESKEASRSGLTKPTKWYLPETAPAAGVDGIDRKGHAALSKYEAVLAKIYSASALPASKTRGAALIGKHDHGKMWKYRKTLKKLLTAAGATASSGTPKGERNMYSLKGNGNTGDTVRPKNAQQTPLADSYELWPIDQGK